MKPSVTIIGGGLGGLFCGAFLAKNGFQVTVLEKNHVIGGGLQCFYRRGKIYETGMHIMGGFNPGGSLHKICSYLGILDKLDLEPVPHDCMDEIYYHSTGEVFRIAAGKEGFIASLSAYFPEETQGLRDYVQELYRLTHEVPLYYLDTENKSLSGHSEHFLMPADQLIAHYVRDRKLREILAYTNPLYDGVAGHTPAYVHALISVLYLNGPCRMAGGSQQLADALADVIKAFDGQVIPEAAVTKLNTDSGKVSEVFTADGRCFHQDYVISSVHPTVLLKMLPEKAFLKAYTKRLKEIPNSRSAFTIFLDLKPETIPYIPHTCYYVNDYGRIWQVASKVDPSWPHGFMYMTPPELNQGKYASRLLVHCLMDYGEVSQWDWSLTGHRPDDYEQWKNERCEQLLDKLENVIPGIRKAVAYRYSSTPLTIRDYFGSKEGSLYGYRKDCENIMESQVPIYTKLRNLYLTGQNINLHGICGTPLTAILTSEALLGKNVLVNNINLAYANGNSPKI